MHATAIAKTIRRVLGVLQDEPDSEASWAELRDALGTPEGGGRPAEDVDGEVQELLGAAREAHEMRREYDAVAQLLEIEVELAEGDRQVDLLRTLARVRDEELLDDVGAVRVYERLRQLVPSDPLPEQAIERSFAKRAKWQELVERYLAEASGAGDASFKSSLLVSAAETAYRYGLGAADDAKAEESATSKGARGKKGKKSKASAKEAVVSERRGVLDDVLERLREAIRLDPKSRRATLFLERVLRDEGQYEELTKVLEAFADEVSSREEKLAAVLRLARLLKKKLGAPDRAATAYERALDVSPGHPEASGALVDYFTEREMWDHLVSLYEGQLQGGGVRSGQEVGVVLQIAMVNWKMRGKPEAAEPHFEKLRALEPAHPGMLAFFREFCREKSDPARLLTVLGDAQRALSDGPERAKVAGEIAELAEEGANAQKAIDQWRSVLRSEPANTTAREALKRLYRQTGAFNHLADVLRGELEQLAADDAKARLPVLAEISTIYRDHIKSDSALVTILSQIIALDPTDAGAVRELARVYEALGRWRDLLTCQMRLAELEPEPPVKAELYRSIARRWLDQFSNVQNAVDAYERLRQANPTDREAVEKLKELYTKRRAYRQLYELYEAEAGRASGAERRALWNEMAKVAADRLDRGADAARLYKQVLAEDPSDLGALDALERQAERDKDFATVADALEARARVTTDDAARLAVLQKLGGTYTDRLHDQEGALRTWRRVLELAPGHAKALRILRESYLALGDYDGLTALYVPEGDWDGLVEVLSAAADRATEPEVKVGLSLRCAAIYEEQLGAKERAFRAYERILSVHPTDAHAARALLEICEKEEKWARLPALIEVLLVHAKDDDEKRALYRKLAEVRGGRLGERAAAFAASDKAFDLGPSDPAALAELEAWARASGEWGAFAATLERRAANPATGDDERRALQLKLAQVSASHAGRPDDAVRAYRALLERNPKDEDALAALDRMLRTLPDRQDDLRWLFRHRVGGTEGEGKVALLREWALLEEESFGSAEGAAALYRELLEILPNDLAALRVLTRLTLAAGQYEQAASLLMRRRDLETGADRSAREIELARVYLGPLKAPTEALAAAMRALETSREDRQAIGILEELLPISEARVAAATALERAYEDVGAWAKQAEVLSVLIATAPSKKDRLALQRRLAEVKVKLSDDTGAFDVLLRAVEEHPSELDLWDRLAVLANKTQRTQAFVDAMAQTLAAAQSGGALPPEVERDLAERAAVLYDEMLGDIDRAAGYLDRVLAMDPSNDRAFGRLKQILTARERWRDLEALYERALSVVSEADRRVELLGEVAIVAEEITNDAPLAIRYYERILELAPSHAQAMFALDKLYVGQERWQKLADLLVRRVALAGEGEKDGLHLRLGTLLFAQLGDPKAALDHLEIVLANDASVRSARELVEKCLTHPDLRQRAALVLEATYTERDEMRELVKVLEIRLEFAVDDAERRDLLRRIAELRDERLTDDLGALEAYARLLPLAPGDVEARQRYLEIAGRQGRREQAAEVLTTAARNADSPELRAELLTEVAQIFEASGATERAEGVYRQILELAPTDALITLPAARALERICSAQPEKARELATVLKVQVQLEGSATVRRELLGRLARLEEEVLKDDVAAIASWKACVEDDPADREALGALDRLYERSADHLALVEVLRAREEHAGDASDRRAFMVRTAEALAERVGDVPSAIVAYRAVLDDFGPDVPVLSALSALYEKAEAWPDLAETIELQLSIEQDGARRVALFSALGGVRHKRLGELPAALEAYRQALALDPEDARARGALEGLLEDEGGRETAANILRPLYERPGCEVQLVRVLEILIDVADDRDARLSLLARAAEVAEGALEDLPRGFAYVSRGVREAASEASLPGWLARAERLTERTGAWASLAALYRDVVADLVDEEAHVGLLLRTAELARTKLSDAALAKQYYRKALELRPEHTGALIALEELYAEASEHEPLLEILGRRAELATSDDDKRALLTKLAHICDAEQNDRDRAVETYERILDLGFDVPAGKALERLYAALSRWGDLVALYERELELPDLEPRRRADLHHALGDLHQRSLSDVDGAFEAFAEALREDPLHEPTIASLERLMEQPVHAARAASMLEAVYVARLDWRKVMGSIEARLVGSEDPDDRRTLLRRLAKLHEEQEENYDAALTVTAKLLHEEPTLEATWAELERLARVANAERRLAEIYAAELDTITSDEPATARLAFRAGELFEGQGDAERALGLYRRAYQFDPEEEQAAFGAIDRILTRLSRPADRIALYRDALEYRVDPAQRLATLQSIATLEESDLHDDEAAISTYRAMVEVDETDVTALEALARLFTKGERYRDLADLHRRRAEQSAMPDEEASFRLALAGVLDERLHEGASAIDELETITSLVDPIASEAGKIAVARLEALLSRDEARARVVELLLPIYAASDEWPKLVHLSEHRFLLAVTTADKVMVLRDRAQLLEDRGADLRGAFDALKEAFVLDPDDGETREHLDRLAVASERWDDLADAYEQGIAKCEGVGQRELLGALARLHDTRRDDPRRALAAWERLFRLDESDDGPLDEMDRLATLLSDWTTLVRVLARRAEVTPDDETRASLWRRIAEARRDMLDDLSGAIEAYDRALELEPDSTFTLDNLIAANEARSDATRLVELYRRRIELCGEDDEQLRHVLLLDSARCYEVGLNDRREAIARLDEALAKRPDDAEVLERLGALFEGEKLWPELLENLEVRLRLQTTDAERAALKKRIAGLQATELDDPDAAVAAYREVLAVAYDDESARALVRIGESRDELRATVADLLDPVVRAEAARAGEGERAPWALLVEVLELRLRSQTEPQARAETQRNIADVAERSLGDLALTERALAAALTETPADDSLHVEMVRVAAMMGPEGFRHYADALTERTAAVLDAKVNAGLLVRLGTIAEVHLGEPRKAAEAYARAAEQGGDTVEILSALERVLSTLSDARALADVLERRIALEAEPQPKADILCRLAALQVGPLADKHQALATLQQALERVPTHERARSAVLELLSDEALFEDAFDVLEAVYRTSAEGALLAALYAKKVERATGTTERTRARLALAKVQETESGDRVAAQRTVEAAVVDDPDDVDVVRELERLAATNGAWAEAATAFGKALEAKAARGEEASASDAAVRAEAWARLGAWQRDHVQDARAAEQAFARAFALDRENVALARALDALMREPGRERERVAMLLVLAKLEGEPEAKREAVRQAVSLAETELRDQALAERALRELLAENEVDAWALAELTRLREVSGDHAEVVGLLLRRADAEVDAARAIALRHRAAEVSSDKLGDNARAVLLHEQVLDLEPGDPHSSERLLVLYGELGRLDDLARHLAKLIDSATTVAERSALRLRLAALQTERFDAGRDAIDTLRAVLEEEPDNAAATDALAAIFERTEQNAELAELQAHIVERARERGDARAELEAMVRLGEINEVRLSDVSAALTTYEAVLVRDASHVGALEAVARLAEQRGQWARAAEAMERLASLAEPTALAELSLRLAAVRGELGDDEGAERALRRALDVAPKERPIRERLAVLYLKGKRWTELAELLVGDADILRDEHPTPEASPEGASSQGDAPAPPHVAEQVRLLRRAAEIHLSERSAPEEAAAVLERATSLSPDDRELLLLLCDAYSAAHRDRDAALVLERVIASFGNKRTKELSVYHHRLGRARAKLGDADVALAQFDMAFRINPGSVEVLRDLGVLALESNDLERAQKTFQALLLQRLDGTSAISKGEVFYYLGEVNLKQGNKAKAVQMLERAIENEPSLDRAKAMLSSLKN